MDWMEPGSMDPVQLGSRLQEARKARKLTQEDVARHLGVARTTVTAIEKGLRQVKPKELLDLAELYGREVSHFMRRLPPAEPFLVQFRAVMNQDLSPELVDTFKRLCDNYAFLERVTGSKTRGEIPQYEVRHLPPDRAGEFVANAERNRLALGDAPIGDMRSLLENDVGLRVFYLDLDPYTAGLFAYTQAHRGCIAVNRRQPPDRNRWTMAHECGHYLTCRFQADVVTLDEHRSSSWAERSADSFAESFLMPSESVNQRFDLVCQQHGGKITPADVLFMSRYFGVSFKAMTLRLEHLRRLSNGTWDVLDSQGFRVREAEVLLEVPVMEEHGEKFPRHYVILAVKAFAQALITEKQLADILDTDRLGARDLVGRVMREAGIDDLSKFCEPLVEG